MLTFAAIARAGGIRGAAAALGTPRSTVSRQLAQLEEAVGAPLVARSSRSFALTHVGEILARSCEDLVRLVRAAEETVRGELHEPTGRLRVATSALVGEELLPEIVARYLARYPKMHIELELSAEYVDLRRSGVDVAVRTGPLADASDLFAVRLGRSLVGHYASPVYLEARGVPRSPEDLAHHDCLVVGRGGKTTWRFRGPDGTQAVAVAGRLRVDSFRAVRAAAAAGAGVLRTAAFFAAPLVERGELVPVLREHWPRVPLFAVHAAGSPAPPKVRVFLDLLRDVLAPRVAELEQGDAHA